jgi:hypothetical protein
VAAFLCRENFFAGKLTEESIEIIFSNLKAEDPAILKKILPYF